MYEGQKEIMSIQFTMDWLLLLSTQTQQKGEQGEAGTNIAKSVKEKGISCEDGNNSFDPNIETAYIWMRKIHKSQGQGKQRDVDNYGWIPDPSYLTTSQDWVSEQRNGYKREPQDTECKRSQEFRLI